MSINQKTFNLILKNTKSFTLKIFDFAVSTSLKILIHISSIHFTTIIHQRIRMITNMRIPKLIMATAYHRLIRMVAPVVIKGPVLTFIRRTINRELTTILLRIRFTTSYHTKLRSLLSMKSGFIHMVLAPIVAVLIKLLTLDPELLSTLDVQTLAQLDHT